MNSKTIEELKTEYRKVTEIANRKPLSKTKLSEVLDESDIPPFVTPGLILVEMLQEALGMFETTLKNETEAGRVRSKGEKIVTSVLVAPLTIPMIVGSVVCAGLATVVEIPVAVPTLIAASIQASVNKNYNKRIGKARLRMKELETQIKEMEASKQTNKIETTEQTIDIEL